MNTQEQERVLWAIPAGMKGAINAVVIASSADPLHLNEAKEWAISNGFHSFKVQTLDGTIPDFSKGVGGNCHES